jgi:hypothetical protein
VIEAVRLGGTASTASVHVVVGPRKFVASPYWTGFVNSHVIARGAVVVGRRVLASHRPTIARRAAARRQKQSCCCDSKYEEDDSWSPRSPPHIIGTAQALAVRSQNRCGARRLFHSSYGLGGLGGAAALPPRETVASSPRCLSLRPHPMHPPRHRSRCCHINRCIQRCSRLIAHLPAACSNGE